MVKKFKICIMFATPSIFFFFFAINLVFSSGKKITLMIFEKFEKLTKLSVYLILTACFIKY